MEDNKLRIWVVMFEGISFNEAGCAELISWPSSFPWGFEQRFYSCQLIPCRWGSCQRFVLNHRPTGTWLIQRDLALRAAWGSIWWSFRRLVSGGEGRFPFFAFHRSGFWGRRCRPCLSCTTGKQLMRLLRTSSQRHRVRVPWSMQS